MPSKAASSQEHLHELFRKAKADGKIRCGFLPEDCRTAWCAWRAETFSGVMEDSSDRSLRARDAMGNVRSSFMGRVVDTLETMFPGNP